MPAGHSEQELRYNSHDQLVERNIYEEDEQWTCYTHR